MLGYFYFFFTDELRNPWQMLVEPWVPLLKIIAVDFGLGCSAEIKRLGRGAHCQPPAHQGPM